MFVGSRCVDEILLLQLGMKNLSCWNMSVSRALSCSQYSSEENARAAKYLKHF